MDFDKFETDFLINLKKNKKECLHMIEANQNLVRANLGEEGNQKTIDKFVNEINKLLYETKKYSLIEKVLKHPFLVNVYNTFKNSNVLIEACKKKDKNVLKWLITMDINPCTQDENGMTALMHASKIYTLLFVVKYLVSKTECLNLLDKNGENAIFHSLNVRVSLIEILKSGIDVNAKNNDGMTPLMYCCKNEIYEPISLLMENERVEVNIIDKEERTPAMILIERGRYNELKALRNSDFNYRNSKNETALSILIEQMYLSDSVIFADYLRIISILVFTNCDFNIPVDNIGNTALMVFMIVQDWYTVYHIVMNKKNIDLSIKNNFGESATSLFMKYGSYNKSIYEVFVNNKTFDYNYIDNNNNNNMLLYSAMKEPTLIKTIVEEDINVINYVNSRNENALILATKFNNAKAVDELLKYGIFVNQQDYLGNTALYYAVDVKNFDIINLLLANGADKDIKNNEGISSLNHAHNLCDKKLIEVLTTPVESLYKNFENLCKLNNSMENYRDTEEYLYPCIHNIYPTFKMTYPIECLEKSIYMGNPRNITMSYRVGTYVNF